MSFTFKKLMAKAQRLVAELRWPALLVMSVGHLGATWALLAGAGETELTDPLTYAYFYATTATTVGYGDLSPATQAGRFVAIFWLFPGAIAIFTAILSKVIGDVGDYWRRKMAGQADYSERDGLTVLIGFRHGQTLRMIDEFRRDAHMEGQELLLVAKVDARPLPEDVLFVRVEQLSDATGLARAGLAHARQVLIVGQDDDETLAATLAAQSVAGHDTHIVAYFNSEHSARLVRSLSRPVEAVVSPAMELVVRAAQDPGASQLFTALVSAEDDFGTVFSLTLDGDRRLEDVRHELTAKGGMLMAYKRPGNEQFRLPTGNDYDFCAGDRLFYLAPKRLTLEGA